MSDSNNNDRGRKPDQLAYNVKDIGNDKSYWTQIGAVYHHKDGKGSNIKLDTVPVNGEITLRDYADSTMNNRDRDQAQPQQSQDRQRNRSYER